MNEPAAPESPSPVLASLREHWGWFAVAAGLLALFWALSPILAPFAVGATLAYLGDPLVDRLERLRLSRTLAVAMVFLVVTAIAVLALVLVVPVLEEQVLSLIQNIPDWLHWLQDSGLPKLGVKLPRGVHLDADGLRKVLAEHWDGASDFASVMLGHVGRSTPALLGFVADLLLIPIVSFYLLRDWDLMVARIGKLWPRRYARRGLAFALETDEVLAALIRGQLLVMLALAVFYCIGLSVIGLKVALLIGLLTGLVSFIPYLGFFGSLIAATIAMAVQTQDPFEVVKVLIVYGIGQVLESGVLTPMLVGDRIGLHPVAVIFAILAGGQLFGFVGVLVALPVAAVVAVLVRSATQRWLESTLYLGGKVPPAAPSADSADEANGAS
jgi:predicted PurR-regulated permease PerM